MVRLAPSHWMPNGPPPRRLAHSGDWGPVITRSLKRMPARSERLWMAATAASMALPDAIPPLAVGWRSAQPTLTTKPSTRPEVDVSGAPLRSSRPTSIDFAAVGVDGGRFRRAAASAPNGWVMKTVRNRTRPALIAARRTAMPPFATRVTRGHVSRPPGSVRSARSEVVDGQPRQRSRQSGQVGAEELERALPALRGDVGVVGAEGVLLVAEGMAGTRVHGEGHVLAHAAQLRLEGGGRGRAEEVVVLRHVALYRRGEP